MSTYFFWSPSSDTVLDFAAEARCGPASEEGGDPPFFGNDKSQRPAREEPELFADESVRRGEPSGGNTRGARARDGAKTAPRGPVRSIRVFARFIPVFARGGQKRFTKFEPSKIVENAPY